MRLPRPIWTREFELSRQISQKSKDPQHDDTARQDVHVIAFFSTLHCCGPTFRALYLVDISATNTMSFRVIERCIDLLDFKLIHVEELGRYKTEKQAIKAAISFRQQNDYFDLWEEVMEDCDPDSLNEPPFCSWEEACNPFDKEGYEIYIEDTKLLQEESAAKIIQLLASEQGKEKTRLTSSFYQPVFGKCDIRNDLFDPNFFIREPSRLSEVAIKLAPDAFPVNVVDLYRRMSNGAYACMSVACENAGVQFSFRKPTSGRAFVRSDAVMARPTMPPPAEDPVLRPAEPFMVYKVSDIHLHNMKSYYNSNGEVTLYYDDKNSQWFDYMASRGTK